MMMPTPMKIRMRPKPERGSTTGLQREWSSSELKKYGISMAADSGESEP